MAYRLFLFCLLLASMGYTMLARLIPMDPWTAEELVNAQTLPTVYGAVLSIVLLVLLVRGQTPATAVQGMQLIRAGGLCAIVVGFILALGWMSLWVALGVLLFTASAWLGERRWLPMSALAIGVPLAGFIAIELALGVYLPSS